MPGYQTTYPPCSAYPGYDRTRGSTRTGGRSLDEQTEEALRVLKGLNGRMDAIEEEQKELRLRDLELYDRVAATSRYRGSATRDRVLTADGGVPGRIFTSDAAAQDFCKDLQKLYSGEKRKMILTSALSSEIDVSGGFLVNEEIRSDILAILEQVGQIYGISGRFPMPARKVTVPMLTALPTAAFVSEGVEPDEADIDFGAVTWDAEEAACYLLVPNQLLEDAATADLGNWLAVQMVRALVLLRERVLAKGTGSPADGGIVGILESGDVTVETMAGGETAFSNLGFKHLTQLEAAVVDDGSDNLRYVLSRSVLKLVKDITGSAAGPIWHPPNLSQPPTLNGYPYVVTPQFPTAGDSAVSKKFLAFGNFNTGLQVGNRLDIRVEMSRDFKFASRMSAFLALTRFDAHVIPGSESGKNPIAVLKTAAS